MNKIENKKQKGFTLMEILVVVAIIAILTGLTAAYFSKNRKNQAALRAAEMLAQDIRYMMERAVTMDANYVSGDLVGAGSSVGIIFSTSDTYATYEIDPLTRILNSNSVRKAVNPGEQLGMQVTFTVTPDSGHRSDRIYFLADPSYDWTGTITVNCDGAKRYIKVGQGSKTNVQITTAP
ncbi:MAG: prepilin-type N-terminal cleavage/methylation domain-containing protein [Chloroflexi bacterium]|nr:prepilin-type N-terminal cleavage/methylation domain-containing protein [Chloroflexota bacterium]